VPVAATELFCMTAIAARSASLDPSGELADLSTPHPRLSTSPIERPPRTVR
jgi:hypothetical protein